MRDPDMELDLLEVCADALEAAGLRAYLVPMLDGEHGIYVRFATSNIVQTYMDTTSDVDIQLDLWARCASEMQCVAWCDLASAVLRSEPLPSRNGSYDFRSASQLSGATVAETTPEGLCTYRTQIIVHITV